MLGWIAVRTSPNVDEVGHLPAGLLVYEQGRFDGYKVNPPLVKTVAALPVWLASPEYDWQVPRLPHKTRLEWRLGYSFLRANGPGALFYWTMARWACIPLVLTGGLVCFRWASDLCGDKAGIVALALWCFSPNVLASGATVCADAIAASLGVCACYTFRNWLREPTIRAAVLAGISLGFAQLTKTSWIILYLVFPAIWVVFQAQKFGIGRASVRQYRMIQLILILLTSLYVLNSGFGFQGTFTRLGDFEFRSHALTGETIPKSSKTGGNRFAESAFGRFPVPLPRPYVEGIDLQKLDFEVGQISYLRGQWKKPGWWYWYLYAVLVKVPLGTLALLGLSILVGFRNLLWWRGRRSSSISGDGTMVVDGQAGTELDAAERRPQSYIPLEDKLCLLVPSIGLFAFVSSQTGFTIYFRYVLPCFPFAFIWISQLACCRGWISRVVPFCVAASVASSLCVFPHSMEFFNIGVGGPKNGHKHLLHTSLEFGQNGIYVAEWLDAHSEVQQVHFDLYYGLPMLVLGLEQTREENSKWLIVDQTRLHEQNRKYENLQGVAPYARLPGGLCVFPR